MLDNMDKNFKILVIVGLVVILISFSAAFLLGKTATPTLSNLDKLSELYILVPNSTSSNNTATMTDGTNFAFTPDGSKYKASINDSLNVSFAIINHEGHSMNYTILAYQSQSDIRTPNSNFTRLFYGAARVMTDNDTLTGWIVFSPAYTNNNTVIGIVLLDNQQDGNLHILNKTEIRADLYN